MKKIISTILVLILGLHLAALNANAAEFRLATKEGENITISQDETVRNLYAAGNAVSINGTVEKSLYAAGSTVTINSNVENDLNVGGFSVVIKGDVGGSIHAGGMNVLIEGKVADDVFVGGGNVTLTQTASIGGDLIAGAGVITIQSPISGNIYLGAGQATINSKVDGKIIAQVDDLTIGSQAQIADQITYTSPKEATVAQGAQITQNIIFQQKLQAEKSKAIASPKLIMKLISIGFLFKILASITVALALVYLFGDLLKNLVKESLTNFWPNLGTGFAVLFLTPILAFILLITLIASLLAGLTMMTYVLMVLISIPLASISFGSWLMKFFKKQSQYEVNWKTVVLGVIAMSAVILLPLVGWLIMFIFMLISLGSLYRLAHRKLIVKNKTK